jgi:peroxiredoxin Q/BCP
MSLTSTTLRIGDSAPNFTLPDLDGRPFELADVIQGGSALICFAPGIWSQTTRRQIRELEAAHAELEALDVIPLVLVTQRPRDAHRSLASFLAQPDHSLSDPVLSFPILSDSGRNVARDYGVFRSVSLDGIRVTRPALFLVEPTGRIGFLYVGKNDADVPNTQDVLHLVRALALPRLVAPESTTDSRVVQPWDPSKLPHVSRAGDLPSLGAAAEPLQLIAAPSAPAGNGTEAADHPTNHAAASGPNTVIALGPSHSESNGALSPGKNQHDDDG